MRFKPAYNPYTEPSMEIFGCATPIASLRAPYHIAIPRRYHPELKKWTEIGNSGMFRPEMLRPMVGLGHRPDQS